MRGNANAFVLLDVPYLPEMRASNALDIYGYEMSTKEHIHMLETIRDAKCCIMLCGYRRKNGNDLYDEYLIKHGWKHYKLAELVKSCQNKKEKDIAEEWIWVNYELPSFAKYVIDLSTAA